MSSELTKKLMEGEEFEKDPNSRDAIPIYEQIIQYQFKNADEVNDDTVKAKE